MFNTPSSASSLTASIISGSTSSYLNGKKTRPLQLSSSTRRPKSAPEGGRNPELATMELANMWADFVTMPDPARLARLQSRQAVVACYSAPALGRDLLSSKKNKSSKKGNPKSKGGLLPAAATASPATTSNVTIDNSEFIDENGSRKKVRNKLTDLNLALFDHKWKEAQKLAPSVVNSDHGQESKAAVEAILAAAREARSKSGVMLDRGNGAANNNNEDENESSNPEIEGLRRFGRALAAADYEKAKELSDKIMESPVSRGAGIQMLLCQARDVRTGAEQYITHSPDVKSSKTSALSGYTLLPEWKPKIATARAPNTAESARKQRELERKKYEDEDYGHLDVHVASGNSVRFTVNNTSPVSGETPMTISQAMQGSKPSPLTGTLSITVSSCLDLPVEEQSQHKRNLWKPTSAFGRQPVSKRSSSPAYSFGQTPRF